MDLNRFTQKAQEAIQRSFSIAARYYNQQTECEHLLLALVEQDSGLVPTLLDRMGAETSRS